MVNKDFRTNQAPPRPPNHLEMADSSTYTEPPEVADVIEAAKAPEQVDDENTARRIKPVFSKDFSFDGEDLDFSIRPLPADIPEANDPKAWYAPDSVTLLPLSETEQESSAIQNPPASVAKDNTPPKVKESSTPTS